MEDQNRKGKAAQFLPLQGEGFITIRYSAARRDRKRHLQKLILAHSDIWAAHQTSVHFLNIIPASTSHGGTPYAGMDHPLHSSLSSAVVVSYAKPFTNNQGLGVLKKSWTQFDNPKWTKCHERILKARHELFAHSDAAVRCIKICPPGEKKYLEERSVVGIGYGIRGYALTLSEIETIAALSNDLARRLHAEVERLIEELYGGMELPEKDFLLRFDNGL